MSLPPSPVTFNWDQHNLKKNWIKHQVEAKEAEEVFYNTKLTILKDKFHSQTENRYIALGKTNRNRKLYIVFTLRNNQIRIISARDQSRKERNLYEKRNK
jgi:hypothetical protein